MRAAVHARLGRWWTWTPTAALATTSPIPSLTFSLKPACAPPARDGEQIGCPYWPQDVSTLVSR